MLSQSIKEHVRAGFAGIWVQSHEHDEATRQIAKVCRETSESTGRQWNMLVWDIDRGLSVNGKEPDGNPDPIAPLKALVGFPQQDQTFVLVMHNFHRFIDSVEIMQCVANAIAAGKELGRHIVVLSCMVKIPAELEKHFVVIEHELPDRETLGTLAERMELVHNPGALDAAAGLTRYEAENAFALSAVRHKSKDISPETIWDIKSGALKKAGTLELHRGNEKFSDLGGLDAMKTFCVRAMTQGSETARAKGVLLLGVPGAGKSAFAKALGNEVNRPTITMDFGSLMGSLVGESEAKTRQALQIIDRMSPCILFCDEIEKGLSGAASGHNGDSGVSQRMFGTLLTWLNDHESDVFFVGTCNDIQQLTGVSAGAFTRAERFDGIFFIDLPSDEQRLVIWDMYAKRFGVEQNLGALCVEDDGWTGAEIKSCCRLAALLGISLEEASNMVVPVSKTASGQIANLREWADGRALDANRSGIYRRQQAPVVSGGRRIV